ncbi:hypothetical protein CRUP_026037, partial [Coryphaenoides rupestris]
PASPGSAQYPGSPGQDNGRNPDYQVEPEGAGGPVYPVGRPRRTMARPRARRGRPRREEPGPGGQQQAQQTQQALSCKHCRKTFSRLLQLKAHQAVHVANADKPFQCLQCGRGFSFQRSLNAHMLLHT